MSTISGGTRGVGIGVADYVVFGVSLVIPVIISLYFCCIKKQTSNSDFLMGNRSINAIPMSFSLCASYMSAVIITGKYQKVQSIIARIIYNLEYISSNDHPIFLFFFLGVPGEIAYHGWIFPITWLVSVSVAALVAGNLFIPIFYKMRLVSVYEVYMQFSIYKWKINYEGKWIYDSLAICFIIKVCLKIIIFQYLELRYESRILRLLASFSYVIGILMYMGVVLYAPCLALQTITDLPIFGLILLSGITGTVYTVMVSNSWRTKSDTCLISLHD